MEPKVSVITVVFNGEKYLETAIRSVISQTYKNIEYIVIDGKSTDGTTAIIKRYNDHIDKWVSETDAGIYDAMNKGISYATGALIGILNADDWYEPDSIEKIVRSYEQNPEGDIFHGLINFCDESGNVQYITGHTSDALSRGMEHPSYFIRKTTYQKYGSFNSSYKSAGDFELALRLKKNNCQFIFLPEILANFRSGGASGSLTGAIETLNLKYKYHFISNFKRLILIGYWRIKALIE